MDKLDVKENDKSPLFKKSPDRQNSPMLLEVGLKKMEAVAGKEHKGASGMLVIFYLFF